MELPEIVIKKLGKAAEKLNKDLEFMTKEYMKVFNDDFIQKDAQFQDDEQRHQYAIGTFWTDFVQRPPVNPYDVMPVGVDSLYYNKSTGIPFTSLFVFDDGAKLHRVSLQGDTCDIVKEMAFFHLYKGVNMGLFRDSNDFSADERTEFKDPEPVPNFEFKDILDYLKLEPVPIIETPEHLSRVDNAGRPDRMDWKCIHGHIRWASHSKEDADRAWARYTISDLSVDPERKPNPDGSISASGITLWLNPVLQRYPKKSECYFLGNLVGSERKDKTIEVQMNCFCILPIIIVPGGDE